MTPEEKRELRRKWARTIILDIRAIGETNTERIEAAILESVINHMVACEGQINREEQAEKNISYVNPGPILVVQVSPKHGTQVGVFDSQEVAERVIGEQFIDASPNAPMKWVSFQENNVTNYGTDDFMNKWSRFKRLKPITTHHDE